MAGARFSAQHKHCQVSYREACEFNLHAFQQVVFRAIRSSAYGKPPRSNGKAKRAQRKYHVGSASRFRLISLPSGVSLHSSDGSESHIEGALITLTVTRTGGAKMLRIHKKAWMDVDGAFSRQSRDEQREVRPASFVSENRPTTILAHVPGSGSGTHPC